MGGLPGGHTRLPHPQPDKWSPEVPPQKHLQWPRREAESLDTPSKMRTVHHQDTGPSLPLHKTETEQLEYHSLPSTWSGLLPWEAPSPRALTLPSQGWDRPFSPANAWTSVPPISLARAAKAVSLPLQDQGAGHLPQRALHCWQAPIHLSESTPDSAHEPEHVPAALRSKACNPVYHSCHSCHTAPGPSEPPTRPGQPGTERREAGP